MHVTEYPNNNSDYPHSILSPQKWQTIQIDYWCRIIECLTNSCISCLIAEHEFSSQQVVWARLIWDLHGAILVEKHTRYCGLQQELVRVGGNNPGQQMFNNWWLGYHDHCWNVPKAMGRFSYQTPTFVWCLLPMSLRMDQTSRSCFVLGRKWPDGNKFFSHDHPWRIVTEVPMVFADKISRTVSCGWGATSDDHFLGPERGDPSNWKTPSPDTPSW